MSDTTPSLSLPLLAPAQAQKHVTHNEALQVLDTLVQLSVVSDTETAPPSAPVPGEGYILPAAPTGAWAGQSGAVAVWNGEAWLFYPPRAGWLAHVAASQGGGAALVLFDGAAWGALPQGALQGVARLGLGTDADAANPFAAKLNSALWAARETAEGGTGSLVQTLNKPASGADLGFVLQEGYSTRAILGFFGSSDLRLGVSADGTAFNDALVVNRATGAVSQPRLPRFKAVTNYDNAIPANVWTKVGINQTEYNAQGAFNAATNRFTAPSAGTYAFFANLMFQLDTQVNVRMNGRLTINGTTVLTGSAGETSGPHRSEATNLSVHGMAALAAGDTVELQCFMRFEAGRLMANQTAFWGWKIG